MSAAIAIDFGTSRTKLAYLDDITGRTELMRLGHRDDPFIPSLFYLERDSERVLLGDDAEAMLEQDAAGVVEVLKRNLHEAHVRANRRRVAPVELMTLLLAELRTRAGREVSAFGGQLAATVHLTMPAIYGPSQERILREAAGQAGFTNVVLVPEPVAAARAWLAQASGTSAGVVVFDCGGGTIDWAYLRRDGEDFRLVPECPPGGDRVGGYDLDRELLARIEDRLDDAAIAELRGHEAASLQAVRVVKERYCRGLPLQPVRIGGDQVRLSPSDIESAFAARFIGHACEGLNGYLSQVHAVSGQDLPPVLLVGGSARIKGLREAIERDCGCESVWWERADYATVLGAVLGHQDPSRVAAPFPSDDIARDVAEAIEAFRSSDDDGFAYVETHADERIEAWRAAAEAGLSGAQWLLGLCVAFVSSKDEDESGYAQAFLWLRKAAEQGQANAQVMLGNLYQYGGWGVNEDRIQAVAWYRKAAEQGHALAQITLGEIYREGPSELQDDAQAFVWYHKAAEQGHTGSQAILGAMYREGRGVPQDDAQAVVWSRKAAEQGDEDAQAMLGDMYLKGQGLPQDNAQAVVWYRKAAEQDHAGAQFNLCLMKAERGDASAQFELGEMYHYGQGVTEDRTQSVALYLKAAEQGHADAQYTLGEICGMCHDDAQSFAWYRKAAEQGHDEAQVTLGNMYRYGYQGVPKDDAQAAVWYRKTAEQGYAQIQLTLGEMYLNGQGVPQDDAQAFVWYHKAAEQGNAGSQAMVGAMYREGRGVTQDDTQAVVWYRKSAERGQAYAQFMLGVMYAEGQGVKQDDTQAVAWYRKAAEQGDADAQNNLGVMYAEGRGVKQDDTQAVAWYRKAAEQGDANAQFNLGCKYEEGRWVKKDDAQAAVWYRKAAEQGQANAQAKLNGDGSSAVIGGVIGGLLGILFGSS